MKIYAVDTVVDIFFGIDIVLTFFLAYIDRTTHLLVRDKKKIVVRLVDHEPLSHSVAETELGNH